MYCMICPSGVSGCLWNSRKWFSTTLEANLLDCWLDPVVHLLQLKSTLIHFNLFLHKMPFSSNGYTSMCCQWQCVIWWNVTLVMTIVLLPNCPYMKRQLVKVQCRYLTWVLRLKSQYIELSLFLRQFFKFFNFA